MAAVFDGEKAVGFLALHGHNFATSEVHVMGVLAEYHRQGIGRQLVDWAIERCMAQGKRFLIVKTLAASDPHPGYARTRLFYEAMGFLPIQVFPELWDKDNPCLLMGMALGGKAQRDDDSINK